MPQDITLWVLKTPPVWLAEDRRYVTFVKCQRFGSQYLWRKQTTISVKHVTAYRASTPLPLGLFLYFSTWQDKYWIDDFDNIQVTW